MYIQYLIKTVGENRFLKIRSVKNRFVNFRLFANPSPLVPESRCSLQFSSNPVKISDPSQVFGFNPSYNFGPIQSQFPIPVKRSVSNLIKFRSFVILPLRSWRKMSSLPFCAHLRVDYWLKYPKYDL